MACRAPLLIRPFGPAVQSDCQTVQYRYGFVQGARQAGCGSFLSCLQRHYSNGKSCSKPELLLLLILRFGGARLWCGCSWAAVAVMREDGFELSTRSVARSLITCPLVHFPQPPSGRCGNQSSMLGVLSPFLAG